MPSRETNPYLDSALIMAKSWCTYMALLLYATSIAASEVDGESPILHQIGGFSDSRCNELLLRAGDNPCEVLRDYCNSIPQHCNTNYEICFQHFHRAVISHLLADWDSAITNLTLDEGLFIDCAPIETESYHPDLQCSSDTYSAAGEDTEFDCSISRLIPELIALLRAPTEGGVDEAVLKFDSRRNEVKMTPLQMVHLYRQAILLHPNNSYIVNQFGLALMYLGRNDLAQQLFGNAVARGVWAHPLQRPELNYIQGLTSKPWHNKMDHPFFAKLEAGYEIIKDELLHNLRENKNIFQGEQGFTNQVNDEGEWTALRLKVDHGYTKIGENYFPKTLKVLQDCRVFLTAMFSAIKPGTHILPHTGPCNDRLRGHLGVIHTGGARIRVGTEWRTWEEGKALIMDTSWEHEVIHDGNDLRVVLIVDFWHPELAMSETVA